MFISGFQQTCSNTSWLEMCFYHSASDVQLYSSISPCIQRQDCSCEELVSSYGNGRNEGYQAENMFAQTSYEFYGTYSQLSLYGRLHQLAIAHINHGEK